MPSTTYLHPRSQESQIFRNSFFSLSSRPLSSRVNIVHILTSASNIYSDMDAKTEKPAS